MFFSDYDLSKVLGNELTKLRARIEKYSNDEIMSNDLEILADNCYEQFKVEPVIIEDEDHTKRDISSEKIQVEGNFYRYGLGNKNIEIDGIVAKFYFPYTGDETLFKCRASTFTMSGYPNAELFNNYIVFKYVLRLNELSTEEDKEKLLKRLKTEIDQIKQGISFVNKDINGFNSSLRDKALNMLIERKKNIEQYYKISKMFEVPLKRSEFATTHIPMQRKIIPISKTYNKEDTYCISDAEYKFILETIKHSGSTYERTPVSYKSLNEETLRDILLSSLNGMYQGNATGEAFRNKGKTDICIEKENRAAFVAECKIWSGPSSVEEAIKQLDSYLTWRDCKTALVFFSRNKDFLKVLDSAKAAINSIENIRQVKNLDKNEYDCSFASLSNSGQIIRIRVMIFNLYTEK